MSENEINCWITIALPKEDEVQVEGNGDEHGSTEKFNEVTLSVKVGLVVPKRLLHKHT